MQEVFVVSACRTAIGGFGGVTKDVPLEILGAKAIAEGLRRARIDAADVAEVHALRDRGKRRGVASLCIGTGMGIAMGIELV